MTKTATCIALIGASITLGGCMPMPDPVVSSFNDASVGIQLPGSQMQYAAADANAALIAKADQEAASICARGPRRTAEFVSSRRLSTGPYSFVIERLYLCLN